MDNFKIKTIPVGSFGVNASIFTLADKTYVVDPGGDFAALSAHLNATTTLPTAILLTHAHFDHIGAVNEFEKAFPSLPVVVSQKDIEMFGHPLNVCPPDYLSVSRPLHLIEAETASLPNIEVIATPGHTPGGVCFYLKNQNLLFSGDTLFAGSVGRTDLPGGDCAMLMNSIEKLKLLPPETRVIPGHGVFTTIGDELKHNPFFT